MDAFPYPLPLLLDGPMLDPLERAGLPAGACPEEWAVQHRNAVSDLHREAAAAGAQVLLSPTLGANAGCLAAYGLEQEAAALSAALMRHTRETAQALGLPCGARVGPSGLFVAPYGDTDFDDLYGLYREQIRALDEAGAEFLLLESQNSLADARAAVLAARTTNLPILVSLSVDASGKTLTGGGLLPAAITLQAMGVEAVGLEGAFAPILEALEETVPHMGIPLLARANVEGLSPQTYAGKVRKLLRGGARVLGPGQGAGPAYLSAVAPLLKDFGPLPLSEDPDCHAAAIENEVFFLGEGIFFSEPLLCTTHLDEDLIDLDDERVNAALVVVETPDDARILARNSTMTRLPIAIHCDSRPVLDAALRYFQGRLILDSDCAMEEEELLPLIKKYGAIYY